MQATNRGRILKEFQDFSKNAEASNIQISLVDEDINHWKGIITGPKDTPYEGGYFQVDIQLPVDYPYKPPKMKFDTKIWHPNISSQTGAICLDILKNEWSPALSIRTALLSLQALMCAPEPDDPQDAVVASEYKTDKKKYAETAKNWTEEYASPKKQEEKINMIIEMGFDKVKAKEALMKSNWDVEMALNSLFS
mmetsp:Transcript_56951/g.65245  ORF Transcript_56951/g.65245 Transcript_56951/m.65245 type:complete len:194 (-) Transcript_56951:120-701(-)